MFVRDKSLVEIFHHYHYAGCRVLEYVHSRRSNPPIGQNDIGPYFPWLQFSNCWLLAASQYWLLWYREREGVRPAGVQVRLQQVHPLVLAVRRRDRLPGRTGRVGRDMQWVWDFYTGTWLNLNPAEVNKEENCDIGEFKCESNGACIPAEWR